MMTTICVYRKEHQPNVFMRSTRTFDTFKGKLLSHKISTGDLVQTIIITNSKETRTPEIDELKTSFYRILKGEIIT